MVDSMSKPKQMMAYDRFELTGSGYIFHDDDDPYFEETSEEEIPGDPLRDYKKCPYCSTKLLKVEDEVYEKDSHREYCLWYCQNCRFWQARLYSEPYRACIPPPDHWAYLSKLRKFNESLPEGCSEELAVHIRSHPNLLYSFDPTRFEKFVADVFAANYANAEVRHVGGPNDGGVDVLLIDAEMKQWLIQVKHRETQNIAERVSTIRDILGAMVVKGVGRGIVVSTANRFSPQAIQAVAEAKVEPYGMTVQLVDSGIFNRMLDPVLPDRPWLSPITQLDAELAGYLVDEIPSNNQLELFTTTQLFGLN